MLKKFNIYICGDSFVDWHPGWKGCYDFYVKLHKFLNIDEPIVEFKNKINKII